jgi:hypothetical protein
MIGFGTSPMTGGLAADIVVGRRLLPGGDAASAIALPNLPAADARGDVAWLAGDLNGDGRSDAVLVLRDNDPKKFIDTGAASRPRFDTNPRILAVVFAGDKGGYGLVLENHTFIARTTDPFQQDPLDPNGIQEGDVAIKNGTLRITLGYFGGNMGRMTYTFRFQNGPFALIGYDRVDVTRNSGVISDISINYSTQQMVRKIGHISNDTDKTTRSKLPRKPLLTLEQIGDGLAFQGVPE